jgi:hypothetical protein
MDIIGSVFRYGIVLQALAIVHFARRRPDGYWLWIILMGGGLGAAVYILAEVLPDAGLLRGTMRAFPRRRRIHELERAVIDNPSSGNFEELADLYVEDRKFARARELYDKAITPRTDHVDPFYRRAIAALELKDAAAAIPDLERVVAKDPKYDLYRATALLAHAHAQAGDAARADALFKQATSLSTSSETYCNYATFLASQQRWPESREWAERVLAKKPTMPRYLQRRERPWFRAAKALLKQQDAANRKTAA